MKLALMYEIPVPRPWGPTSAHDAFQRTLEQMAEGALPAPQPPRPS